MFCQDWQMTLLVLFGVEMKNGPLVRQVGMKVFGTRGANTAQVGSGWHQNSSKFSSADPEKICMSNDFRMANQTTWSSVQTASQIHCSVLTVSHSIKASMATVASRSFVRASVLAGRARTNGKTEPLSVRGTIFPKYCFSKITIL